MEDSAVRFRRKLEELCALGRRSGMRLSAGQVQDALKDEKLTADQLGMVYTYLDQMAIEVFDPDPEESPAGQHRRGALEVYLEEVERIAPLPEDVEYGLFERAAEGDTEAANTLIERYLTTACDLASEYEGKHPKVETEDLVQEANIALVTAVAELEKEKSLAAYRARLLNRIAGSMEESVKRLEEMMNSDSRIVNRLNQLADTVRELEEQLGHRPSIEEVSAFLELPEEDIRDLLRAGGADLKISPGQPPGSPLFPEG